MSILNAKGREKNNIHTVCNISVELAKTSPANYQNRTNLNF
jgi:hypothetical protein